MELVSIGLILAGLALVFFGAALSVYATALLGFLIGGFGGYVIAPQLLGTLGASGPVGLAVAVIVGGGLGAALAYVALSFATSIPAFVVGAYIGLYVVTPLFTEGGLVRYLVMILGGVVGGDRLLRSRRSLRYHLRPRFRPLFRSPRSLGRPARRFPRPFRWSRS